MNTDYTIYLQNLNTNKILKRVNKHYENETDINKVAIEHKYLLKGYENNLKDYVICISDKWHENNPVGYFPYFTELNTINFM